MKRAILLSALLLGLCAVLTAAIGADLGSSTDLAPTVALNAATSTQPLVSSSGQTGWGQTSWGQTQCLCVCYAYIWSIGDVFTSGSCDELNGTPCWNNWGSGYYGDCQQDGLPLPLP